MIKHRSVTLIKLTLACLRNICWLFDIILFVQTANKKNNIRSHKNAYSLCIIFKYNLSNVDKIRYYCMYQNCIIQTITTPSTTLNIWISGNDICLYLLLCYYFKFEGQSVKGDLIPIMGQVVQIGKYVFEPQAVLVNQTIEDKLLIEIHPVLTFVCLWVP